MKISELICELEKSKKHYGDCPVWISILDNDEVKYIEIKWVDMGYDPDLTEHIFSIRCKQEK